MYPPPHPRTVLGTDSGRSARVIENHNFWKKHCESGSQLSIFLKIVLIFCIGSIVMLLLESSTMNPALYHEFISGVLRGQIFLAGSYQGEPAPGPQGASELKVLIYLPLI